MGHFFLMLAFQVICKSDAPTGDVLLDEALKHVKETQPPETVQNWIELLSGKFLCGLKIEFCLKIFSYKFKILLKGA